MRSIRRRAHAHTRQNAGESASSGYAHAYHERVIADVLARADGYKHRSLMHQVQDAGRSDTTKGSIIRARIAANAQKRYEIAQAMKSEAGVVDHQLTRELSGGVAWTDRARILAPAGENRVQLATLAHECGHVFLHCIGSDGYLLPGHVKEMEAESYAHQSFAAHSMQMPAQITAWGRSYVGRWVEEDRAIGIPIDPRAEAYANGKRSPYEPLRKVPANWTARGRLLAKVSLGLPFPKSWYIQKPRRIRQRSPYVTEALSMTVFVLRSMIFGTILAHFSISLPAIRSALGMPLTTSAFPTHEDVVAAVVAGIVFASVALSLATMVLPLGCAKPHQQE